MCILPCDVQISYQGVFQQLIPRIKVTPGYLYASYRLHGAEHAIT